MTFLETFSAVFTATVIGQIAIWFVQRYILTHFTLFAEKIEKPIKKSIKKVVKTKKDYKKSILFGKRKW